jgi:hypothetical protein
MSSIQINGNTSGSITIEAPAVAGTNTLTLPASTGTVLTDTAPKAGNILQVVSLAANQGGSAVSTTSATFGSTGFSLSITPSSSSSKILVITHGAMTQTQTSGTGCLATIYRGATNLANGATNGFAYYENSTSSGFQWVSGTMVTLDSPATTSSTTYTIYFRAVDNGAGTGTAYYSINYAGNGITLMEIAG